MSDLTLVRTRIQAGAWEGVLTQNGSDAAEPRLGVSHGETAIESVQLEADPEQDGTWRVRIAIPAECLSDGVQTFVISDARNGDRLDSFTIVAGEPLADDIRAEVDLLRAELDMLKRAFRRHCLETMS